MDIGDVSWYDYYYGSSAGGVNVDDAPVGTHGNPSIARYTCQTLHSPQYLKLTCLITIF